MAKGSDYDGGCAGRRAGGPVYDGFILPAFLFQSSLFNSSRRSKTIDAGGRDAWRTGLGSAPQKG